MPIILDLDNTLLNTGRLKEELSRALIKFGISEKRFQQIYERLRKKSFYNHEIYLDYLKKEHPAVDLKKCEKALQKSDEKIKNYLYPDALWFLKKMKQRGAKLIMLSYGDLEYQKIKIKETKIKKFFDQIIITEKEKTPIVAKLIKNSKEKVFFINDDTDEIKEIAKKLENITILHIKRKERDKAIPNVMLSQIPSFANLKEVEKFLNHKS